jgi:hypothetical protein
MPTINDDRRPVCYGVETEDALLRAVTQWTVKVWAVTPHSGVRVSIDEQIKSRRKPIVRHFMSVGQRPVCVHRFFSSPSSFSPSEPQIFSKVHRSAPSFSSSVVLILSSLNAITLEADVRRAVPRGGACCQSPRRRVAPLSPSAALKNC